MGGPAGIDPQDWAYFPEEPPVCMECGKICSDMNRTMVCDECERKFEQEDSDMRDSEVQRGK